MSLESAKTHYIDLSADERKEFRQWIIDELNTIHKGERVIVKVEHQVFWELVNTVFIAESTASYGEQVKVRREDGRVSSIASLAAFSLARASEAEMRGVVRNPNDSVTSE